MGAASKLRTSLFARFIKGGGARKLAFGLVVAVAFLLMPVMAWGAGPDGVTASALPGEDYEPGTALVAGIELSGREGGAIAVDSNGSVGINATVTVQNINEAKASSVWLAFEFRIPKVGTSYTNGFYSSWSFAERSYSWLMDLKDPTKVATPVEEDGSIVLRGMVLTENPGGNVLNSRYTRTVQVENSGSEDGEEVAVSARAWIASDGAGGAESASPVTVRVSANADYSARNSLDGPQISGYYNPKTGQFSTVKPNPEDGYVYGRVYTSRVSISRKNTATEWIDPAATVKTTVSFELKATDENGDAVAVPDGMQPIVIGAKRCDKRLSAQENQLESAPLKDLSFGGLIGNPYDAWNMGEYTFRVDEDDPAAVTASSVNRGGQVPTLGNDSLPHFVAFVFVPLDRSGDSTIEELTLTSTVDTMTVQTVGGASATVTCPESTTTVPLAPKDDDVVAMFSRWTNAYELSNTAEAGGTKTITNAVTGGGNVVDYQVRAVNQLIKFSSGLEPTKAYEHGKLWLNYKNIPGSEKTATQTFLWAVKPDGEGWTGAKEMSGTRADKLRYYDKLDDAKRAGTVVGVLVEYRGGMWQSGGMLGGVAIDFRVTGGPGTVGSCVQDVYMWMSGKDTDVSYAGLNGKEPTQKATGWSGEMFPTEANEEGYYRPGRWPEGSREPQELDSNTYGDTIYIMAGTVGIDKAESQVLNGTDIDQDGKHGAGNAYWPISAFDFGQDQRIVDRVLTIEVTGAAGKPVHISVDLDVTKNSVFSLYGGVHLSTEENPVTYTKGENAASPGTFTGGQTLNEGDLQDLTLPGPGTYQLYYSSLIGNPTDLSEDITEAADYESYVQIKLLDKSVRDFMLGRSGQHYYSTVSLMSASGLDKRAGSPVAGDTFTWTLSYTASTQDAQDVFVLDVLPFEQDGRGTTFTGSYRIVNGEVPISYTTASGSDATGSLLRLFYTTDPKIREGVLPTADIFTSVTDDELAGSTITVGNMTWTKAKLNDEGDAYQVPTDQKLTAVMLCGDVREGERATATLSFDAKSLEGGAVLVNSATYRNATSEHASETGDVKITKGQRSVEGLAFLDTDGNDLYEQGTDDTLLPGLTVELFEALEDGSAGGRIASDTSGRAYDVSTGEDGSYRFEDVPESEYGYVVKFSSRDGAFADRLSCQRWASGAADPGGAKGSDEDSDIGELSHEGDAFVATTDDFTLPNDAELGELGVASFVYGGVNAGFEEGVHLSYDDNVQDEDIVVPSDATLYRSGSTAKVSDQVPVRAGWTFAGWNTKPDGKGEACAPGGTIALVDDTVLYAQWSRIPVGSLTVRKVLAGTGAESGRRFAITVTLDDTTVTGSHGDMEFKGGVATVELAGGESSTAAGLPAGTGYRVSEQDYSADGYTSTIEQAEGTVSDGGSVEITVTNRRDATGPVNPGGPGEPDDPDIPTDPDDPDIPTDPDDPTDPDVPEDPETPTDPEDPTEPEVPEEPGTPADPEEPAEPDTPQDEMPQTGDFGPLLAGVVATAAAGALAAGILLRRR